MISFNEQKRLCKYLVIITLSMITGMYLFNQLLIYLQII